MWYKFWCCCVSRYSFFWFFLFLMDIINILMFVCFRGVMVVFNGVKLGVLVFILFVIIIKILGMFFCMFFLLENSFLFVSKRVWFSLVYFFLWIILFKILWNWLFVRLLENWVLIVGMMLYWMSFMWFLILFLRKEFVISLMKFFVCWNLFGVMFFEELSRKVMFMMLL